MLILILPPEFLRTYFDRKKQHMNSLSQLIKILQNSCFPAFGSSASGGRVY